jgi:hypothetical protein
MTRLEERTPAAVLELPMLALTSTPSLNTCRKVAARLVTAV